MANPNNPSQNQVDDFGMEDERKTNDVKAPAASIPATPPAVQPPQPTVNNYAANKPAPTPDTSAQAKVSPAATAVPQAQPVQAQAAAPVATAKPQQAQSTTPQTARSVVTNPVASSKALAGFLGIFGALVLVFVVLSFVFIAQTNKESNPVAKLLGVNDASFVNGLITFIHVIFIICALIAFTFAMVGLFKASMAKKEDKVTRKEGLRMTIVASSILLLILILWIFVYLYLDSKKIVQAGAVSDPIVTDPAITLNLTAPKDIKFDATHVPVSSNFQIVSYNWDFGDDSTGTNSVIMHTYKDKGKNGRFDVQLTVTKRDKSTAAETQDVYTKIVTIADEAVSASFTANPMSGEVPLDVSFDASASVDPDGEISRYEWDFNEDGDYSDAEGVQVKHTFSKIGKYKVGLRVTSTLGTYGMSEQEIDVQDAKNPVATIEVVDQPSAYAIGTEYVFKADKSSSPNGEITAYAWDFGDGTEVQKTSTAAHTFAKEGAYEINLKVTDKTKKTAESTLKVTVGLPSGVPRAAIKTDPALPAKADALEGKIPFTVAFDASGSTDSGENITDYQWDFDGDGKIDNYGIKVSHTYTTEGTFNVTLSVIDSDKNVGKAKTIVKATSAGITAALKADPIEGESPLTVGFDASGSLFPKGQITSYQWDFDDGTSPKLGSAKMTHKYTAIGTYNPKVTVIGNDNSKSTTTILITVRETPLMSCFKSVFEEGKAPLKTSFDPACSTGSITKYLWDFGDGSTATEIKPTHTYAKAGDYDATLEISDQDNNTSKSHVVIKVTE